MYEYDDAEAPRDGARNLVRQASQGDETENVDKRREDCRWQQTITRHRQQASVETKKQQCGEM